MTFIIGPGGVKNTESTDIIIGGKVNVGGSFTNTGKVKVFESGELNVNKEFLNSGDLSINDPEKIKQIIIESLGTSRTVAEFGLEILKKFKLLN